MNTYKKESCKTIQNVNYEGEKKRLYCNVHKEDGLMDAINKTCKEEVRIEPFFTNENETIGVYCSVALM